MVFVASKTNLICWCRTTARERLYTALGLMYCGCTRRLAQSSGRYAATSTISVSAKVQEKSPGLERTPNCWPKDTLRERSAGTDKDRISIQKPQTVTRCVGS